MYLVARDLLVIDVLNGDFSIVAGLECTDKAKMIYKNDCPFLQESQIRDDSYNIRSFWTLKSIIISRLVLLSLWFLFFLSLSAALGSFLTYQIKPSRRSNIEPKK